MSAIFRDALLARRERFNALFAEARHYQPQLDGAAFGLVLIESVAPLVEATAAAVVAEPPKVEAAATATAEASASAVASAEPSASADASASAEAEAKPASALSADEIKALKKKAETAINRGDNKAAVEAATEALKADDTDALTYLYLGSAYMSTGKMKEAKQAFNDCADKAQKSPHYGECIQMGGKKSK